jgi:hypothetical protein
MEFEESICGLVGEAKIRKPQSSNGLAKKVGEPANFPTVSKKISGTIPGEHARPDRPATT